MLEIQIGIVVIKREFPVIIVQKKILSEDDCDILNRKLQYIRPGMIIIIYYDKSQYVQLEGKVSKINLETKIIQIVKSKINIKFIVDINYDESPEI